MPLHPLVDAVSRSSMNADARAQAQQDADAVDQLVNLLPLVDATSEGRAYLESAAREVETRLQPYLTNCPAAPFVTWYERVRQRLHGRAAELFGADGWKVAPPLHHQPLPMPPRGSGGRMFGL